MAERLPLVPGTGGTLAELPDADTLRKDLGVAERVLTGLTHTNGGLGGTAATTLSAATAGSYRFIVNLPFGVTRWRLHLRNWEYAQTSKTAATLKTLIAGFHAPLTTGTGLDTGDYQGSSATTVVSTDQTIPGTSGTWYTAPWVSTVGATPDGSNQLLIGVGYTFGASTALQTGAGRAWHWTNATSAVNPATAASGSTQQYVPFDYKFEYDVTTRRKIVLVIGDSIHEGITGSNTALSSTPLWRNAVETWAARTNRIIVNLSLAGIALTHFATTPSTNYLWTRRDLTAHPIDEIIIAAGSNDFSSSRTLAQMQADVLTILTHLRTTLGLTAPVYFGTLLARGATGDAVRLTYHEWISQLPFATAGVIDFAGATRGVSAQAIWAEYESDTIHPSWYGNKAMAGELIRMLPL